jgi:hypothetical protein
LPADLYRLVCSDEVLVGRVIKRHGWARHFRLLEMRDFVNDPAACTCAWLRLVIFARFTMVGGVVNENRKIGRMGRSVVVVGKFRDFHQPRCLP